MRALLIANASIQTQIPQVAEQEYTYSLPDSLKMRESSHSTTIPM